MTRLEQLKDCSTFTCLPALLIIGSLTFGVVDSLALLVGDGVALLLVGRLALLLLHGGARVRALLVSGSAVRPGQWLLQRTLGVSFCNI